MTNPRTIIAVGALAALLAVTLGAFGAHALRPRFEADPRLADTYQTAVRYHFYHALALVAVGVVAALWPSQLLSYAAWAFLGGLLLFSGSLYLLSLTGASWLGMVAPIGGLAYVAGWGLLAAAALRG
jgi:uncharacterized membrane protein YgdD (TMEM256/DUF423 family)